MKRLLMLVLFSLFVVSCGSDNKNPGTRGEKNGNGGGSSPYNSNNGETHLGKCSVPSNKVCSDYLLTGQVDPSRVSSAKDVVSKVCSEGTGTYSEGTCDTQGAVGVCTLEQRIEGVVLKIRMVVSEGDRETVKNTCDALQGQLQ
ncbi:MAG: hypothetical protein HY537_06595 [Deltaproteobacteria bacterium]|nr:hypothetical protein [Deltaproteobacteria bacterium]